MSFENAMFLLFIFTIQALIYGSLAAALGWCAKIGMLRRYGSVDSDPSKKLLRDILIMLCFIAILLVIK